jgi:hypothetical protein
VFTNEADRTRAQRATPLLRRIVQRQDNASRFRQHLAQAAHKIDAITVRQTEIDEDDVWPHCRCQRQSLGSGGSLANDEHVRLAAQTQPQATARGRVVVHYEQSQDAQSVGLSIPVRQSMWRNGAEDPVRKYFG